MLKKLHNLYINKKDKIEERLEEFKENGRSSEKEIFAEMCFCILTPQSKAVYADKSIKKLKDSGILYAGGEDKIREKLTGVRFPNNKSSYIVRTRDEFTRNGKLNIKEVLNRDIPVFEIREELVKRVTGYGYKEASHFLRNTGRGKKVAILDRHILKELKQFEVIEKIPGTISRKKYFEIEEKMKDFSSKISIPLDALDLLFWYKETGYFFK
ncbi:MAG: N-glycosylase/DNA lyase [Elusimicrobiota bacterium]